MRQDFDYSPIVLDTDGAVGALPGERRLMLQSRQEELRLGCTRQAMRALSNDLDAFMQQPYGTVFMGSGDYHHLSALLVARMMPDRPMRVVVLDNHPDNMRFAGHIHCGSWISHVAALPQVAQVDVVGITSTDIGWRHAWENRLSPLRRGRLRYWSVGVDTSWSRWVGATGAMRGFADMPSLLAALLSDLHACSAPVYLSIDKDVFAPDVVRTNWDQGVMRSAQAQAIIAACHGRIIGSDITGEVSAYRYETWWKRWVSMLDGQDTNLCEAQLRPCRGAQHRLNTILLQHLASASRRA